MSEHTPLTEAERELLSSLCDNEATRGAGEDGYCYKHYAPVKWAGHANAHEVCCVSVEDYVEQVLAARTSTATADTGLRERVEAAHPVTEYRQCGRRIAEHPNPPPGPPDPPHGCARPADGHPPEECYDYQGIRLTAFARPETPIVETEPRVFYDCQTCPREQQDRTSPTPCPTLAALDATAAPTTGEHDLTDAEVADALAAAETLCRERHRARWTTVIEQRTTCLSCKATAISELRDRLAAPTTDTGAGPCS